METLSGPQRRALGSVLRAARLRVAWTQEEAGRHAKLARAYIAHIERGNKAPSMAVLARYCRAMGVSATDVLEESGLTQPREAGIHPVLLEGLRRLDPDTQARLAASWHHFERFITACLATSARDEPGG
jgi:transcriptional regulator with XRE-family HTH domain